MTFILPRPTLLPALEMLCLNWKSCDRDQEAIALMKSELARGIDPNGYYQSRGGDIFPLAALARVSSYGNQVTPEKYASLCVAAKMLIEAGAHPTYEVSDVFTMSHRFALVVVELLGEREAAGLGYRGLKGESVAHHMIEPVSDDLIVPGPLWEVGLNIQRKGDLFTPLHVLWDKACDFQSKSQIQFSRLLTSSYLLNKTHKAIELGAQLHLRNQDGETVARYITRKMQDIKLDSPTDQERIGSWKAIEAQLLSEGCEVASASPRSSPRL